MPTPVNPNAAAFADFTDLMYRQRRVRDAFARHVSPDYVQHNPTLPDGPEAAVAVLHPMFNRPGFEISVHRQMLDGDLGMLYLKVRPHPEAPYAAVVDLFRFADGKIVEHWDVKQEMPPNPVSRHPFF